MCDGNRVLGILSRGALLAAVLAATGLAGCGNNDNGPAPDTTPPVITAGPSVLHPTSSTVTIEWTTNEASNSVVRYGPDSTVTYSQSSGSLVTAHSVVLSAHIVPDSTLYYLVQSTDAAGNTASSAIQVFTPTGVELRVAPDTTHAAAGGHVTVNLEVRSVTDLFGAVATLGFDQNLVRCDSVSAGLMLTQGGHEVTTVSHIDNGNGTVEVGIVRHAPDPGQGGDGILAHFHFTALAAGTSPVHIEPGALEFTNSAGDTIDNFTTMRLVDGAIVVAP